CVRRLARRACECKRTAALAAELPPGLVLARAPRTAHFTKGSREIVRCPEARHAAIRYCLRKSRFGNGDRPPREPPETMRALSLPHPSGPVKIIRRLSRKLCGSAAGASD